MKLLIAGGGTGGHLYPGIAIAETFLAKSSENQILFVGTKQGIETRILPKLKFPLRFISIQGWAGKPWVKKIETLGLVFISFFQSLWILFQFKPDVVLGIGGYASFPMLLAAWFMKKKTVIQEQNRYPGVANKILARLVKKIFSSFEDSLKYFPVDKTIVTGNPIRSFAQSEALQGSHSEREARNTSPDAKFTVFIFGGSQGAHSLNRAMLDALAYLSDIKPQIHIIHQVGSKDLSWVQSAYFQHQWEAEIYDFIYDMGSAYVRADYVICRSGATSVAELSALRKACLFVPFPYATHNHQEENARLLEQKGAAKILLDWQLNGTEIAKEIKWAFNSPRELEEMRKKITEFAKPYAAKAIVDELLRYNVDENGPSLLGPKKDR